MKNILIIPVSALLVITMTSGCTSKPVMSSKTTTPLIGAGQNGGVQTSGLNNGSGLQSQTLDAFHQALKERLVHFDLDSSDIAAKYFPLLNKHVQYLMSNGAAHVVLKGNTDERGTREYNMALGERRAKAVQTYLVSNGVNSQQIDVVSYGKEEPLKLGHDEASWAANRRVEIDYDKQDPDQAQ